MIIADGVRSDVLARSIDNGQLPALAALRDEGSLATITSAFPSVTGPAYAPFIMGRYPGSVGLPGLRWFDRSRRVARLSGHSRSYVGAEMRFVDRDIDKASPTIFELAKPSMGALSVISRGLRRRERIGQSAAFIARAAATHFRGDVQGWLAIDRSVGEEVAHRLRTRRMKFAFAAFTGIDKTSHAAGQDAPIVAEAMRIVDDTVAEIRSDAERDGRWNRMQIWVGSDHGHSSVRYHEDLNGLIAGWGYTTLAHPWAFNSSADIAVMVSGNAMAHLYLNLDQKVRPWWPALGERWHELATNVLSRESVDLMILPTSSSSCEIHSHTRGMATLVWKESAYSYTPESGDPLEIGRQESLDDRGAYDATIETDYPDALVQIAHLAASPRSGDIILSAARDWDYRAKYEPIPHVSSHGALHREHMLVPLLLNRPPAFTPRRTVDVMPSALAALGITAPKTLDGVSFY
ncbi:MAG: type phosphodiesterase/nucleotide pyrophosphatase [Gemmatimonadales bacterium]|nr:type phosphodiesterase/nucleotide pyrophosphatase [Gemmatimonadales bacterium]